MPTKLSFLNNNTISNTVSVSLNAVLESIIDLVDANSAVFIRIDDAEVS